MTAYAIVRMSAYAAAVAQGIMAGADEQSAALEIVRNLNPITAESFLAAVAHAVDEEFGLEICTVEDHRDLDEDVELPA